MSESIRWVGLTPILYISNELDPADVAATPGPVVMFRKGQILAPIVVAPPIPRPETVW